MRRSATAIMLILGILMLAKPARCEVTGGDEPEGFVFTLWPLIDYRESPAEGFSNLGILGPLIKIQKQKEDRVFALRPLFYRSSNDVHESASTDYLYPLASSDTSPDVSRFQFLHLVQNNSYNREEPEKQEQDSMFFPFYISGTSKKHGPYRSFFPIYGDIYDRFWRDEYHFVLFPLYGSTVKKGTTSRNYLYPIFNTIHGENESGFHVWPLYGQSAKEGVYQKRFVLWPFYMSSSTALDTDNPTENLFLFPLYASTDSPRVTSRTYLWPFAGYSEDRSKSLKQTNFIWPLIWTARGEETHVDSYLPFYFNEEKKGSSKSWYLWPIYRYDSLTSADFTRERSRILFFLYSDNLEKWPKEGSEKRRTAFWPLFLYNRDPRGVSTFSFPALVEPILDRDGIEQSWAPLWRLYQQKWNEKGDSTASLLWNLYWHESRGKALAWELYPLLYYRGGERMTDMSILKGLIRYRSEGSQQKINLLWLPFGITWGEQSPAKSVMKGGTDGGGS